ncbi:hypothetical protein SRHO_G00105840 [Serrasalmus rhombeus]
MGRLATALVSVSASEMERPVLRTVSLLVTQKATHVFTFIFIHSPFSLWTVIYCALTVKSRKRVACMNFISILCIRKVSALHKSVLLPVACSYIFPPERSLNLQP